MSDDRAYVGRLGEVLRGRDPAVLREFLAEQAGRFGDERQVAEVRAKDSAELEMLLHRMTLARPDLADLHAESADWLAAHGLAAAPPGRRSGRGSSHRKPRRRD